nr:hypothetical protein [Tanacetum cinerariifolium]
MVEEPKPMKKKKHDELDEEYARKLHEELNKDIDWDTAIEHIKQKAKEDSAMQLDYFKGMSYDDIHPIYEAKFNTNIEFLLKSKEQIEKEEIRAFESIIETPAQKSAKRRKLNKKVAELNKHLEIMPDEDDDVFTKATPLARKADDQAQIWKNQRTVYGQARVKSWKLLKSYGVHIVTSSTIQLILLVERKYPLSRYTLEQMLNAIKLRVAEQSEMSLELLSFGVDAAMDLEEKH